MFTKKERSEGFLFVLPWFIGFLLFQAAPIIQSLSLSFTEWDLMSKPLFVGFNNYVHLFSKDPLFWKSLKVTLIYALCSIPLCVITALIVALLLNQAIPGRSVLRAIYYLPAITSGVAVSMAWRLIYNPDFGLLNYLLLKFGIHGPAWLSDTKWALPSIIIMAIWASGATMILYLAGLQGIPRYLYEAAELDGANSFQKFTKVTLPMLTPTIFFNIVISLIGSLQIFTEAYVMTGGGPQYSTYFYSLYIYENAFRYFKMGYASALAWIIFIVILVLTILQVYLSKKWVYYEF